MPLEIINRSRNRIATISAISALAGAANIWLLALINRDAHLETIVPKNVAEFAIALIVMVAINAFSQIVLSRFSATTFYNLREELVRGITHLTSQTMESIGSHRLYAALTKDIPAIHELVIFLPNYVFNFTVVVACLVYLLTISIKLWLIFIAFLIIALCVAKFAIVDRAETRFQLRRKIEDDLFKNYEAVIEGNKELQLNRNREEQFIRHDLRKHASAYRDATVSSELYWNMSNNWSSAVIFIAIGALLFLSPKLGIIDRSDVVTFIVIIFYMVGPLTILMNSFRTIHAAKIGLKRLNELNLGSSAQMPAMDSMSIDPFNSLSMQGVSFEYEGTEEGRHGFHVGPINLDIARGEIIYFVGGNGSGKTTAAKLLTGLYQKKSGVILVNGEQVTDRTRYFQLFSAVFQDYYLFESIVPKGDRLCDDAAARAMIAKLKLSEKVSVAAGRLSTTKLSHGQRKRLALLVACFDDSEIYVFDEWAADQDPDFREFFYRDFLIELKRLGKTVIVVSHDDRYFHLADRVVKFEFGKIVAITDNTARDVSPSSSPEIATV